MKTNNFHRPIATQAELVSEILAGILSAPETPVQGQYLSFSEAEAIVASTIHHSRVNDSAQEYEYLKGHRHRLAETLTMIPKAETRGASCLDIGCYGYMAYWAWRHLGYEHIEGIEMRPGEPEQMLREIEIDGERLVFPVHNFDISGPDWPLTDTYDTLLFFETLEHVTNDPSGVMLNVTRRMTTTSILVISVPNAVSYKTLQEFLAGAPPWTYWFFHPDLDHEPRHSFEYTPIFFKILLRSAGLEELAFKTITAYVKPETVKDYFDIGRVLSIDKRLFGETIIAQMRKISDEPLFRYPDCIYNANKYYESTYPLLLPRLVAARDSILEHVNEKEELNEQELCRIEEALRRENEANLKAAETLRREKEANLKVDEALRREWEANERASQAALGEREALFLCDMYKSKLDAAEERANKAEEAQRVAEDLAHQNAVRFEEILQSEAWRLTGPVRNLMDILRVLRKQ